MKRAQDIILKPIITEKSMAGISLKKYTFKVCLLYTSLEWYDKHARVLPWRSNPEPYWVWLSEIMLQQTRVEAVLPYFQRFVEVLPDISSLAYASEEQLHKLWEGLGYYSRIRNLHKAARQVVERYDGKLPPSYELLLDLCGIGEYTAGAIA